MMIEAVCDFKCDSCEFDYYSWEWIIMRDSACNFNYLFYRECGDLADTGGSRCRCSSSRIQCSRRYWATRRSPRTTRWMCRRYLKWKLLMLNLLKVCNIITYLNFLSTAVKLKGGVWEFWRICLYVFMYVRFFVPL